MNSSGQVQNPERAARALYVLVFVSGAVLMGIEIAGARILAPGFGTSTYVWGSIIGMFMGALAAGYYFGGSLADKMPSFKTLALIVSAAAIWTALLPRFGPAMADGIARMDMGRVAGPLFASFTLFFIPSFLMGMVSPYSVKLNASSLAGVGGVAGRLYALSTFGSIVGTLLTTFVLLSYFNLSTVLMSLGLFLLATAGVCMALFNTSVGKLTRSSATVVGMLMLVTLMGVTSSMAYPVNPGLYPGQRMIRYEDSPYHDILVTEDFIDIDDQLQEDHDGGRLLPVCSWEPNDTKRWLKFNDNIESGVYPYRSEYKNAVSYTDLLHLPLLWVKEPKRMLVVGGGGGIVPSQYFLWYGTQVDIAEIDEKVSRTAQTYFEMPRKDGKLVDAIRFHIGDGRQTVRQLKDTYDVIVLDAYSSGGQIPFHLMTWEFMREIKSKLAPGGVLVTNIITALRNKPNTENAHNADLFLAEYNTLTASRAQANNISSINPEDNEPLFKNIYVFPRLYWFDAGYTDGNLADYRNVIIVATNEDQRKPIAGSPDSMEELASELSATSLLKSDDKDRRTFPKEAKVKCDLWPIVRHHKIFSSMNIPSAAELATVPRVMTDDYAPVDRMYRPVKKDESMRRIR